MVDAPFWAEKLYGRVSLFAPAPGSRLLTRRDWSLTTGLTLIRGIFSSDLVGLFGVFRRIWCSVIREAKISDDYNRQPFIADFLSSERGDREPALVALNPCDKTGKESLCGIKPTDTFVRRVSVWF